MINNTYDIRLLPEKNNNKNFTRFLPEKINARLHNKKTRSKLAEAKCLRSRPKLQGWGRVQNFGLDATLASGT